MPRAMPTPDNTPRGKPGDYEEIPISNKLLAKVGPGYAPTLPPLNGPTTSSNR